MTTAFSTLDQTFMAQALDLAEQGAYTTRPNPRVGCVLAQGDRIVGSGWHQRAGGPHAEAIALQAAGAEARGATAYVTLEPCSHHGRTPPCANALIAAGVTRVVVACGDPNPKVAGGGLARLREAGIKVQTGLMETQARALNAGFFSRIERGRPWLRLKLAMSLDGRTALADGSSKWITGAAARTDVQRWRARAGAILTGSGTALADDPRLTVRLADTEVAPTWRVVLDRQLRTPAGFHLLDGSAPTLVFHDQALQPDGRFAATTCVGLPLRDGHLPLLTVLEDLAARGIDEVQVEAGSILGGALFQAGLADEWLLYVAPVLLGPDARPLLALPAVADMAERWHLQVQDVQQIGEDVRWRLKPQTRAP